MAYATIEDSIVAARFRTGTSATDFASTNAGLMALVNKHLRKISLALHDNNEDWFATITNVSLSSGIQSYALSADSGTSGGGNITVNRVEISYDGTNWVVATPLDYEQIATPTNSIQNVNDNFSTTQPFYATYGNLIYTFPWAVQDVASGMRVFEVVRQGEASNSSVQFNSVTNASLYNLPKEFMEPFEDFLVADLYERIGKTQEAMASRQAGESRLEQLRVQFQPRNEDFDLNVTSNAYEDYGE